MAESPDHRLSDVLAGLPHELDDLLLWTTEKDPTARPASGSLPAMSTPGPSPDAVPVDLAFTGEQKRWPSRPRATRSG